MNNISSRFRTLTTALLLTGLAPAFAQVDAPEHAHQHHSHQHSAEEHHFHHEDHEDHENHEHAHEHSEYEHSEHDHGEHDHELHHETRLVYVDAASHTLNVLDPAGGKLTGRFGTIGRISLLALGPNGRTLYAIHRDDSRITVLESGLLLVSHGDHNDLQTRNPFVLATLNVGAGPTHFAKGKGAAGEELVAFFNDKDGAVALLPEALVGVTNDLQTVQVSNPDHGALALVGGKLFAGALNAGTVAAYDLATGKKVASMGECKRVHGAAQNQQHAYFGCVGGVLGVHLQQEGSAPHPDFMPNPAGTPDDVRVAAIRAHQGSPRVYGNFGNGVLSWTTELKDPQVTKLSAAPIDMAFDKSGKHFFVLSEDGTLHRLDSATGHLEQSLRLLPKPEKPDKQAVQEGKYAHPYLAATEHDVWVSYPAAGQIIQVDGATLRPEKRFAVGGQPTLLEVAELEGAQH